MKLYLIPIISLTWILTLMTSPNTYFSEEKFPEQIEKNGMLMGISGEPNHEFENSNSLSLRTYNQANSESVHLESQEINNVDYFWYSVKEHSIYQDSKCFASFTLETHEWINNEYKRDDGGTLDEHLERKGMYEFSLPIISPSRGNVAVAAGKGSETINYKKVFTLGKKQRNETITGVRRLTDVKGAVFIAADGTMRASITLYLKNDIHSRAWGKGYGSTGSYDYASVDTSQVKETKSFLLSDFVNNYGYGDHKAGSSTAVRFFPSPFGNIAEEIESRNLSSSIQERITGLIDKVNNPETTNTYVLDSWYTISMAKTVDQALKIINDKDLFMTDLRKLFENYCEKYTSPNELVDALITTDKAIINVINRLNSQYLSEHILSPGQVKLKDWIADQQRDPNSVYSNYAGK